MIQNYLVVFWRKVAPLIIIGTALVILAMAYLTVSAQVLKAAMQKPVDSLKVE